ncbi:MAG: gliding motility-associated C-terminal domain-containing protein [Chitinophagaceae bacterium]|nr:gliding motility-associated C-terminal domain-containing protein [Chitinophagaceae bacterium]
MRKCRPYLSDKENPLWRRIGCGLFFIFTLTDFSGIKAQSLNGGGIGASQCINSGGVPAAFSSVAPAANGVGALSYNWEKSTVISFPGGIGANDIAGANAAAYAEVSSLSAVTYYRRRATDAADPAHPAWSNILTVGIKPVFTPVVPPLPVICQGASSFSVNYTTTQTPDQYNIIWGAAASAAGMVDVNPLLTANNLASPAGSLAVSVPANIATGTYNGILTLRVSATGCSSDPNGSFFVVNPTPSVIVSAPAAVCAPNTVDLTDAVVTAGSTAGITFTQWTDALTTSPIANPNAVSASGTYYIKGTNAFSCSATAAVAAIINPLPSIPTISGAASFCSGNTTTLTSSASPNTYLWNTGQTVQAINVATGGAYTVTVTDNNNCSATSAVKNVTVNALPSTPTISGAASFCSGNTITLTSSASPNTYLWSTGQTVQAINIATGGAYTVTVTDNNNCSATSSVKNVTINPLPAISPITGAGSVCAGSTVTLFSASPGGSWASSAPAVAAIDAVTGILSAVAAGNATISYSITNNSGCSSTVFSNKIVNAVPVLSPITGTSSVCMNNSIQLSNATGGGSWASNNTAIARINSSGLMTAVSPGIAGISYRVTNADGCTSIVSSNRSVLALPAVPVVGGLSYFCVGGSTVLSAPLASSYLWSNGADTRSATISQPGSYTVTVFDQNNCQASSPQIDITALPLPGAVVSADIATCQNAAAPTLLFTGSNGTAPYIFNYTINGGLVQTATSVNNTAAIKALTGTPGSFVYRLISVKESSSAACSASINSASTVAINALPSGNIQSSANFICAGLPRTLTTSGAASYQWYLDQQVIGGATGSSLAATQPGNYMVQLISQQGCISVAANSVDLVLYPKPQLAFAPDKRCLSFPVSFQNQSVFNSSDHIQWNWDFGDGVTAGGFLAVHTYSAEGMYAIRLTADNNDCPNLNTGFSNTFFIESPKPGIRYAPITAVSGKPATLHAREFGARYLWQPAIGLSDLRAQSPVATLRSEQEYTVQIISAQDCITTDTVVVKIFGAAEVFVPKGFTPNGDGQNDRLYPTLVQFQKLNYFKIFNRWGNLVFQTNDTTPGNGWDGRYNGKDQPAGTYAWILEAVDADGNLVQRSGNVLLLR